jgi:hypothetical protein
MEAKMGTRPTRHDPPRETEAARHADAAPVYPAPDDPPPTDPPPSAYTPTSGAPPDNTPPSYTPRPVGTAGGGIDSDHDAISETIPTVKSIERELFALSTVVSRLDSRVDRVIRDAGEARQRESNFTSHVNALEASVAGKLNALQEELTTLIALEIAKLHPSGAPRAASPITPVPYQPAQLDRVKSYQKVCVDAENALSDATDPVEIARLKAIVEKAGQLQDAEWRRATATN